LQGGESGDRVGTRLVSSFHQVLSIGEFLRLCFLCRLIGGCPLSLSVRCLFLLLSFLDAALHGGVHLLHVVEFILRCLS
jgi:hypothetical protein